MFVWRICQQQVIWHWASYLGISFSPLKQSSDWETLCIFLYSSSSNFVSPPQITIKTALLSPHSFCLNFLKILNWLRFHVPSYSFAFWPLALFSVRFHHICQIKASICSLLVIFYCCHQNTWQRAVYGRKRFFWLLVLEGISPPQRGSLGRNPNGRNAWEMLPHPEIS